MTVNVHDFRVVILRHIELVRNVDYQREITSLTLDIVR